MNRTSLLCAARAIAATALLTPGGLLLSSCSRPSEPLPVHDLTISEPIDLGDAELNQAAATARASFAEFLTASANPDSTGTAFMAKIRVTTQATPPVTEDLWVSSITPDGAGSYTGVIGDIPAKIPTLNMSDIVRFAPGQLIEWQYFEREKVIGAQVTRVLRSRMPEAERKEHDAAYGPFSFD